jgi:Biopolymer transport protein
MKLRDWRNRREPRLMVIPMIDIIFFLLVFFILNTLHMVQQNVLPVQLPKAQTADSQPTKQVNITVNKDGVVWIDEKKIETQNFRELIQKEMAADQDVVFIIRADRMVPHGQVVEVMDELKATGVKRVSIATEGGN